MTPGIPAANRIFANRRSSANTRLVRTGLIVATALFAFGCASEGSDVISNELAVLSARAAQGVDSIHRGHLGEGVGAVDEVTRQLALLEVDPRAADTQRLMAVVHQARAWDDAATAILTGHDSAAALGATQRDLLESVLAEKAFPARVAAENSYKRALRMACGLGVDDQPVMLEILDGIDRNGGFAPSAEQPCE